MDKAKTVAWVSMVLGIVLAASMIGVYLNLSDTIQQQANVIKEQENQIQESKNAINEMNDQIDELKFKVGEQDVIINYQTEQIANLTSDMQYFRLPY